LAGRGWCAGEAWQTCLHELTEREAHDALKGALAFGDTETTKDHPLQRADCKDECRDEGIGEQQRAAAGRSDDKTRRKRRRRRLRLRVERQRGGEGKDEPARPALESAHRSARREGSNFF